MSHVICEDGGCGRIGLLLVGTCGRGTELPMLLVVYQIGTCRRVLLHCSGY